MNIIMYGNSIVKMYNKNIMRDKRIETLGFNIKVERMRKKITQAELAEKADISMNTIQKIEAGNLTPSSLILFDISKALEIPLIDLYKDIQ